MKTIVLLVFGTAVLAQISQAADNESPTKRDLKSFLENINSIKDLFNKKNPVIGGNSGRNSKDEDEGKKEDARDIQVFFKDIYAKIKKNFAQTNPAIGGINGARGTKIGVEDKGSSSTKGRKQTI